MCMLKKKSGVVDFEQRGEMSEERMKRKIGAKNALYDGKDSHK